MSILSEILQLVNQLSKSEIAQLKSTLNSVPANDSLKEILTDKLFTEDRVCPHCHNHHIVKNGKRADGTQKYICKDCGKHFTITTNTITFGTHHNIETWRTYIECMCDKLSLRKTAYKCGFSVRTAFLWRHKILDALQNMANDVKIGGIIEADETFFAVSYKGNHKKSTTFTMPRPKHKRGRDSQKRGISKDKICVPCAVTRDGLSIAKISNLGRVSTLALHKVYDNRFEKDSILVTDKMNSYVKFAQTKGIQLVQLKAGKTKRNSYTIQHINQYHSILKEFIYHFHGISTKYLNNYLIWHNLINYAKGSYEEIKSIFLNFVITTEKSVRNIDIPKRSPLPILV